MAGEALAPTGVLAGVETLRRAERNRLCRTLHDQIGPSLCSAGLMVGLLRGTPAALPPPTSDLLTSIEDALESAIEVIRGLTTCAELELATRCGFHSALERLAKAHGVVLDYAPDALALGGEQANVACRILQDALLLGNGAGGERRIQARADAVQLTGAGAPGAAPWQALRHAARGVGLGLRRGRAGSVTLEIRAGSRA
jgi:signal transduction histidine kinase